MGRIRKAELEARLAIMQPLIIAGCQVSRQLNGNDCFILFEGSEQAILDAFNTLWNSNCFSGELEWLNQGQALTCAKCWKVIKGLANREILHLVNKGYLCAGELGRFQALARNKAQAIWDSMPVVRVVKPESSFAPYFYKQVNRPEKADWPTERQDLTDTDND